MVCVWPPPLFAAKICGLLLSVSFLCSTILHVCEFVFFFYLNSYIHCCIFRALCFVLGNWLICKFICSIGGLVSISLLIIAAFVMATLHITCTWRMCHPFFLDAIVWGLLVNISQFIVNLSINILSSLMLCNFYPVFSLEAVVSSSAAKQQRQY